VAPSREKREAARDGQIFFDKVAQRHYPEAPLQNSVAIIAARVSG